MKFSKTDCHLLSASLSQQTNVLSPKSRADKPPLGRTILSTEQIELYENQLWLPTLKLRETLITVPPVLFIAVFPGSSI